MTIYYKGLDLNLRSPMHLKKITYEIGKSYRVDDFDESRANYLQAKLDTDDSVLD